MLLHRGRMQPIDRLREPRIPLNGPRQGHESRALDLSRTGTARQGTTPGVARVFDRETILGDQETFRFGTLSALRSSLWCTSGQLATIGRAQSWQGDCNRLTVRQCATAALRSVMVLDAESFQCGRGRIPSSWWGPANGERLNTEISKTKRGHTWVL